MTVLLFGLCLGLLLLYLPLRAEEGLLTPGIDSMGDTAYGGRGLWTGGHLMEGLQAAGWSWADAWDAVQDVGTDADKGMDVFEKAFDAWADGIEGEIAEAARDGALWRTSPDPPPPDTKESDASDDASNNPGESDDSPGSDHDWAYDNTCWFDKPPNHAFPVEHAALWRSILQGDYRAPRDSTGIEPPPVQRLLPVQAPDVQQ